MGRGFLAVFIACVLGIGVAAHAQLQEPVQPVRIILDSDIAADVDDVGDHALLFALAMRGEANVLALITSSANDYSAPTVRAIAKYYGFPNVPVGAYKGNTPGSFDYTYSYFTQQITSQFGTPGDTRANYPDAVTVYRQALANAPNHSVYIVAGGFYEPLRSLLQSGPDAISSLTGMQLVAQKVVRLIPAAGRNFPDSGSNPEHNLTGDPDAASYLAANWPTEIVWVGSEVGWDVVTGPSATASDATNPIKAAYDLYCDYGRWCPGTRPAWTQVAILYAVRGLATNFYAGGQNGSTVVWGSSQATPGRNIWSQSPNRQHAYIEKSVFAQTLANILNPLVQQAPSGSNHAPVANSQSVNCNGSATAITLTATDADGNPLTYRVVRAPTHGALSGTAPNLTFTPTAGYSGSDSFTFRANDGSVDSNTATVSITITANHPPVANSQAVTSNGSAVPITLTATDQDGNPLTYSVVTNPAHGTLSGTAPNLLYTPTAGYSGSDSFTFRANDGTANSNTATVSITVTANHAPVANSQAVTSNGSAVPITLTATDQDGNPLTYAVVTNPVHGTLSGTAPNLLYTPTAGYSGSDSFTFKANDGLLDSNIATVSITVSVNHPPVANSQAVTSNGTAVAITLTATDQDGNPLTYAVVANPTHGTLSGTAPNLLYTPAAGYAGTDSFTFKANDGKADSNIATVTITVDHPPVANSQPVTSNGSAVSIILTATDQDGNPLTYAVVTNPAHGTLSGTAPNLLYTPTPGYGGTDSFTFKANDGTFDSNIATVSITISINHPPVANSQAVQSNGSAVAITLTATDQDGNPLTYAVVTNPVHGTLSGTVPNLLYTPTTGYSGTDSFTFKANDGKVDSNIATVTITISINHPPVANSQAVLSTGGPVAIVLTATDQDGDPLTYGVVTGPSHGTVSGTAPNLLYTPVTGYAGTDAFTFKANDGKADSNIATVTITVDHPPVANSQPVTSNGSAVSIILTATDQDGNPLTYAVVTNPVHGTLSGTAPNLLYTPTAGYSGSDSFTFKANDGLLDSNIATVSITVSAPPPPPPPVGWSDPAPPVNIILDSDLASDVDDVGDHALLWSLARRAEANVLALITSSTNNYSAPAAYAIANYYGFPNVPIGAHQGSTPNGYGSTYSYYTQQVTSAFGRPGDSRANYPDAVTVYRRALANAPDASVYIVAGGYYQPLQGLLQSGADSISPLSGMQLVAQKVRRLIIAAGRFPDSGSNVEHNLQMDPDAASYVAANWPTELVWLGADVGADVETGPSPTASDTTNPIKYAYDLYCNYGQWCPASRPGWSQVAILFAVRGGVGSNFGVAGQSGSTVVWDSTQATPGRNIWSQSPNRQHAYLTKTVFASTLANIINPLIQAPLGPMNHAPVANSQSVTSYSGATSITLIATDADNDPLTYQLLSNPLHGTLSGSAPNLLYTPTPGYLGTDSFTFKANDGITNSNNATVTITVVPPVALSPSLLNFGDQVISTTSNLQYVTLINNGSTTLTGIAVSLAGANAVDFARTTGAGTSDNCGSSLAVGATCRIWIMFTPTGLGARVATLVVSDSDPLSPQTATLSGTGTPGSSMLVQAASCYPETSCAFDGNVTAGNLLVVFAGSFATNDATISSTAGRCTTWTSLPALNTDPFDGGGTAGVKAFYCRVATTGAATISLASCGPDCGLTMAEFNSTTGWSATPLEVSAYKAADAEDTGTANVGPQTVSANDLLVAYYLDETATQGTISAGPGYILGPKNEGHADAFAYRTNAPSGSYGASLFTTTVSYRYWLAYFLAFRVN